MSKSIFVKGSNFTGGSDRFLPIKDRLQVLQMLRDACEKNASVVLWTKGQELVLHTRLDEHLVPKKYLYVRKTTEDEMKRLQDILLRDNSIECQMLIYQPEKAVIGFKCTVLGTDDMGLQIRFPETIFRVQRRQHQRYRIRSGYQVQVNFPDPSEPLETRGSEGEEHRVTKPVLDISVGGLAFMISSEEKTHYQIGMNIAEAEIELRNRKLTVDVKVQNIQDLTGEGNPGAQIGCAITKIGFDDVEFLSFYIGENTAQFGG